MGGGRVSNLAIDYGYAEYDAHYGRQSLDIKESISIETQLAKCKTISGDRPCKEYFDKGFSGKNTERPDFQRLVEDIKSGLIKRVIVYKIDRISRSLLDFGWIMQLFDEYNVEFTSVNEQFDTSTPIGRAVLNIIMVFAQLERETIQLRCRDSFFARMENGFGMSGRAWYGLKKIPVVHRGKQTHTYEYDERAIAIEKAAQMYAEDELSTLLSIAQHLTEDETIEGNFTHTQIARMLKNPIHVKADADVYNFLKAKGIKMTNSIDDYIGEKGVYIYGTERRNVSAGSFSDEALSKCQATLALHDGLIDSDRWLKIQYKLADKNAHKGSGKFHKDKKTGLGDTKKTWLVGIMKCPYCDKAMYGNASKNRSNVYLTCYGRVQHTCYDRTTPFRLVDVERHVENKLLDFLQQRSHIEAQIKNKENSQVNLLKIDIAKLDTKIDNLINAIADGDDATIVKSFKDKIRKLNIEKNQKTLEMGSLMAKQSEATLESIDLGKIAKDWHNFDREEKQRIARAAIEKVLISNEGIDIIFY